MNELIDKLRRERRLNPEEYARLLECTGGEVQRDAAQAAREVAQEHFGRGVYIRGLIEVSSYCRNDCYYCGLRRSNPNPARYRLDKEQILACCRTGYELGFRTFVLQGGEDPAFDDEHLAEIVTAIRARFSDCAITLSLGERSPESYLRLRRAGADRYLLRHETADAAHYATLHPAAMSFERRMECLKALQRLGYQVGTGMMVGSPGQRIAHLVKDILFIEQLQPQMVGIGPYLPQHDTPFAQMAAGSGEQTLLLLSIFRLMLPQALIPATTALATLLSDGREQAILAGANVVMPNLSPPEARSKYAIYDNKASLGAEAAEGVETLERRLDAIGYHIDYSRGDHPSVGDDKNRTNYV